MELRLLAPLIAIELIMKAVALWDLAHRAGAEVKGHRRWVWAVVIVVFSTFGWALYLAWGRTERIE